MPCRRTRPVPTTDDTVWLNRGHWEELQRTADSWAPLEVGGILLGYRNGFDTVITHIVGPGPEAQHRRYGFSPDEAYQRDAALRVFEETEGVSRYLGDWHTHPDAAARLSSIDKRTLRRIARSTEAQCAAPLMLVLGQGQPTWLPHIYSTHVCWPARAEPVELSLRIFCCSAAAWLRLSALVVQRSNCRAQNASLPAIAKD